MKRDIKIRYDDIESTIDGVKTFKDAVENMKEALKAIKQELDKDTSLSIDELNDMLSTENNKFQSVETELEDLHTIFSDYNSEMTAIISPNVTSDITQVDRNDIWANMVSVENAANKVSRNSYTLARYSVTGYDYYYAYSAESLDEEEERKQRRNKRKVEEILGLLDTARESMSTQVDIMWDLYNNKIKPYENKDDEFAEKADALYTKYSGAGELFLTWLSDIGSGLWDFLKGFFTNLWEMLTGILGLAWGILKYLGSGIVVICSMPFGEPPEWAKKTVDDTHNTVVTILNDPMLIVEGMAQGITDGYDNEGFCYALGYIAPEVIMAVIGSKGLEKLNKVDDIGDAGKVADALDDVADAGSAANKVDDIGDAAKAADDFDDAADAGRAADKVDDVADAGRALQNKTVNLRDQLDEFISNYKNSDEYKSLSNTQRKKVDRKLAMIDDSNIAVAEVDIPNIKEDFSACSQIHSPDHVLSDVSDFSHTPSPEKRIFTDYIEDGYPRYNDTEAKILEDIASQIKDPNVKGKIELFTELDCCESCKSIIAEFRRKYPNIELNVHSNSTVK